MDISFILIRVFAIIGIVDTSYLIITKLRGKEVACFLFPKEWCYKVSHSKQSKTLGVPNSVAGFVLYIAIFALTCLASRGIISVFYPFSVIWFGFLFSIYFLYVQAFVLRAFCTWCVISAINFIAMLILTLVVLL